VKNKGERKELSPVKRGREEAA